MVNEMYWLDPKQDRNANVEGFSACHLQLAFDVGGVPGVSSCLFETIF